MRLYLLGQYRIYTYFYNDIVVLILVLLLHQPLSYGFAIGEDIGGGIVFAVTPEAAEQEEAEPFLTASSSTTSDPSTNPSGFPDHSFTSHLTAQFSIPCSQTPFS